jgi:hypothetical protein
MILRTLLPAGLMSGAAVAALLALPSATPHPAPDLPSHKGDRLRPAPEAPVPFAPWRVPDPAPLAQAAPEPPQPVLEPVPKPVATRTADVCTRHHGWKVMTDNGRSWHCAFR